MARSLFLFFRHLGALGLFLFGAIDSSFLFFLPFGNDFLLIALVSANRRGLIWLLYALMSALGSLVGVIFTDLVARKLGETGLERFVKPGKIKRLRSRLERNTGWTILLGSLLPPPFPFTAVIMTAAALQCSRRKMFIVVLLGRLLRFTIEALLALRFGDQVLAFIDSKAVEYGVYAFVAISVVGTAFSIHKWLASRPDERAKETRAATTEQ